MPVSEIIQSMIVSHDSRDLKWNLRREMAMAHIPAKVGTELRSSGTEPGLRNAGSRYRAEGLWKLAMALTKAEDKGMKGTRRD